MQYVCMCGFIKVSSFFSPPENNCGWAFFLFLFLFFWFGVTSYVFREASCVRQGNSEFNWTLLPLMHSGVMVRYWLLIVSNFLGGSDWLQNGEVKA